MTPAAWHAATDPAELLTFAAPRLSDRKLRLYLVGCCRRRWELFDDPRSRQAVLTAERAADGRATAADLRHAMTEALEAAEEAFWARGKDTPVNGRHELASVAQVTCEMAADLRRTGPPRPGEPYRPHDISAARSVLRLAHVSAKREGVPTAAELATLAGLLRCVAGNPFEYVVFDPKWMTDTVRGLAAGIYADRAFDRLPILADALEDAGCDAGDVLTHCRHAREHARGCWVIDQLLNRE